MLCIFTPMIPADTVQAIRDAARIEEVVGDYVRLRRRGTNLFGLCPFHDEKTPSFSVAPAKGIYKCFGCGAAGDSVRFLMELEHFTYPEALRNLAKRYGIEIQEKEPDPEEKAAYDHRESLFAINEFAAKWFHSQLWESEEGKIAGLSYLRERGFTDELIREFRLGYAPKDWHSFAEAATKEGYKVDYLKELGLLTKNDKPTDMFRERVMFPILSASGRTLAFGGRFLVKKERSPKYINSPESLIYSKREVLYGLFQAKQAMIKEDRCYLVEGYTDVLALHQSGVKNVVASSGTSLTTGQIRLIRRFTPQVTLLYDGDPAGIKASFRGIDMLLEEGMQVRVVLFPEGEDPDSFAKNKSSEELKAFLSENEQGFIAFKTQLLVQDAGKDPLKKAEVLKELVQSIALVPDKLTRTLLITDCASRMGMDEGSLMSELNGMLRRRFKKKQEAQEKEAQKAEASPQAPFPPSPMQEVDDSKPQAPEEPSGTSDQLSLRHRQERELLRLMLLYGNEKVLAHEAGEGGEEPNPELISVTTFILDEIHADDLGFSHPTFLRALEEIEALEQEQREADITPLFLRHSHAEIRGIAIDLVSDRHNLSENWEKRYNIATEKEEDVLRRNVLQSIFRFKLEVVRGLAEKARNELKELSGSGAEFNDQEVMQRLREIQNYVDLTQHFSRELNRVVLNASR